MSGQAMAVASPGALREPQPASSWLASRPRGVLLGLAAVGAAFVVGALGALHLKYGIAGILGIAVVALVLLRPFVGGLILVGLVPVISGLAPGIPIPGIRASEALIGLISVTLMVTARRRDAVPWTSVDWVVLLYGLGWLAMGALDARTSGYHLSFSDWGTLLGQLQFFLIYRGARLAIRTKRERKIALVVILGAAVPAAILAILQELRFPGVVHFLSSITPAVGSNGGTSAGVLNGANPLTNTVAAPAAASAGSLHRATGPFDSWTSLAGYLFPLILTMCALALAGLPRRRRGKFLAASIIVVLGLFVTAELSAIAGLLGGVIALGILFHRGRLVLRWLAIGVAAAAVVVGPFIGHKLTQEMTRSPGSSHSGLPQTLAYRDQVWTSQYFPAIARQPITGYGVVLPRSIQWPYTESQYVSLLMEGGVPVLLLFAGATWVVIDRGRKTARSPDPFDQAVGRALVVSVVALVVMDVIWPYMSNGGLPQVLWALVAVATPLQASKRLPPSWSGNSPRPASGRGANIAETPPS